MELGFGGSQTAIEIAKSYREKGITIVNNDAEMTNKTYALIREDEISNITVSHDDAGEFVKKSMKSYDFIYLLYNFHHIFDSNLRKREKIDFLSLCYDNMQKGTYLCIADAFLPENCDENRLVFCLKQIS